MEKNTQEKRGQNSIPISSQQMPASRARQRPEPEGELQVPATDIHGIAVGPPQRADDEAGAQPAAHSLLPADDNRRIIRNNITEKGFQHSLAPPPCPPALHGRNTQEKRGKNTIPISLQMPASRALQQPEPEGGLQAPAADIHRIAIGPTPPAADEARAQPAAHNLIPADDNRRIIRYNITNNMGFWAKAIVAFCFGSAMQIALLSVQLRTSSQTQSGLPLTLHLLFLPVLLAFTSFFVSKFIDSNRFASAVRLLEGVGVFFGVTAFFMAINTATFPFYFKCITWTLYTVSVLAVLVCNILLA